MDYTLNEGTFISFMITQAAYAPSADLVKRWRSVSSMIRFFISSRIMAALRPLAPLYNKPCSSAGGSSKYGILRVHVINVNVTR